MATKTETRVVKLAAVAQGVALVTFPAASTIFTSPSDYDLSRSAYGLMFVPQAMTAVGASILGASLARRVGTRRIYLIGLIANIVAMVLLVVSATVQHTEAVAYPLLLAATASLGVGFGFTVPSLNTFTAVFNPTKVDSSVLVLNALLGVGTASRRCSSRCSSGSTSGGACRSWRARCSSRSSRSACACRSPSTDRRPSPRPRACRSRPASGSTPRSAVCYGICETMNGNWASLDMKDIGASTTQASLALTAFWASVTIGRVGFAALQRWIPTLRHVPRVARAAGRGVRRDLATSRTTSRRSPSCRSRPLVSAAPRCSR